MNYIIAALGIVLGLIAWICTRKKPEPIPSPDEYWAAVEADEEARRGIRYSEAYSRKRASDLNLDGLKK